MKIIFLSVGFLIFLFVVVMGALTLANHDTVIIGGDYLVPNGEVVHGNLRLFFSQVTLEKNARVEGAILSFSSTLDVWGTVRGNITSLESEINIRPSAQIKDVPMDTSVFPLVLIIPEMARLNLSFGG
jgi:hypothetical protein